MPVSKNRRKGGKKAAKTSVSQPSDQTVVPFPEMADSVPAAMEQLMAELQRGLTSGDLWEEGASDLLSQAQELMYEAWECGTKRGRIAFAKEALDISELCADAWTLLAEEAAKTVVEERGYLEKAVAAGETAVRESLGPDAFEEEEGYFWGILETRPYMRARAALADCLWDMGEREDAVAHWQDMLRLCPGDNLGIRHILAPKLIALNQLQSARDLLDEYEEEAFAEWGYTRALLLFRQGGPNTGTNNALKAAIANNPYVPDYLLGAKRLPKTMPPHYGLGSKEEAILYVLNSGDIWKSAKGALIWLDETVKNTL